MRQAFLLLLVLIWSGSLFAQQQMASVSEMDTSGKVNSIRQAFVKGGFSGSFRSFFMSTDNASGLSDYYALAVGGGLHFRTADFKGFQLGLGGVFNFNVASSDLTAKDPATGALNRYEIGLFDVGNPQNKNDLDRMDELWLRYNWRKSHLTLGKQSINSPFLNPQDGRMRPTAEAGIRAELNDLKNTKIEAAWLWGISPRSTVHWYSIGPSIGLYPKGLNPDGTASGYSENLKSKGVGILGVSRQMGDHTKVQVWDQFVENIFNTILLQTDYTHPLKNNNQLIFGLQFTHQNALADGGNPDAAKTYFQKNGTSNVISTQAGWQRGNLQILAAFTYITKDGRFLSPREWGREPFYTFMARERVEGSGNMQALNGRVNWQNTKKNLQIGLAYGHFYLPDVHQVSLNKYAFPAFNQLNLDTRFAFGGTLKGLRVQFLYVYKGRLADTYGNDKLVINRVNLSNYNLIFNYIF